MVLVGKDLLGVNIVKINGQMSRERYKKKKHLTLKQDSVAVRSLDPPPSQKELGSIPSVRSLLLNETVSCFR